ncbi:MAG: hypothetical protein ACLQU4_14720 [Limisphaerales bacterium]
MNAKSKLIRIPLGLLVLALSAFAGMAADKTTPSVPVAPQKAKTGVIYYNGGASIATFALAGNAKIILGANKNASLNDLAVGEVAHISYTIDNQVWLAHKVVVNPVHHNNPSTNQTNTVPTHPHAAKSNELHAHGKITAYDASAGTISIRFHR